MLRRMNICLLISVTLAIGNTAQATFIFQDNFDSENGGAGALNYTGLTNWNITRGSIDLLGNGFGDDYPGNGMYIDLDGSSFQAARLETVTEFALSPGLYELSFALANNPGEPNLNRLTVSLGTSYSEVFERQGAVPFALVTRLITIAAPTNARLVFDHAGADNGGIYLDTVALQAVPEPSSLILAAFGSVAVAFTGLIRGRRNPMDQERSIGVN